jgi:protein-S-isoprenylcysteine O-methyltransferase Ste14
LFWLKFSLALAVILLLPVTMYRVAAKDRELIGRHGKAYIDYSRTTKRLIPYLY